ncbi:putative LD-carboxypeptidase [Aspergillus clavatus NRRL 1]|uniref:LD-carboxypeptidase, putative n=1 Tax=Aspergillus clavatus (strain ATCC 1007 / CBS 513.65 / DSM 816 / NCTC 3887 / NRRL 1 / QM 1276 / 107) TaxID=344612 RepID=A1C8A5_ASPCL|nr:LD-carboxypeptidase, putative [Aspergillus clavatus NRRL 1]EAW14626.1 LD-carboxypeptidase, putative [Aspergillus clavatus NRRL 1]
MSRTNTTILPPALKKGVTIALISPSLRFNNDFPKAIARGRVCLESLGFKVKIIFTSLPQDATISDMIQVRCEELHAAFAGRGIAAVICMSGGSHANELLPLLDYSLIQAHPKIFIGYSDITFLHFLRPNGAVTPIRLSDTLVINSRAPHICTVEHNDFFFGNDTSKKPRVLVKAPSWRWLRQGRATGYLFRGTVECMVRLLGSPYIPPTWRSSILFLEAAMGDDFRSPYTVDKFRVSLADLTLMEVLRDISGLAIGGGYKYDQQMQDDLAW